MKVRVLLALLCFCVPALAREPGVWRGMKLGEATLEDARQILGEPKKVHKNKKYDTKIDAWLDRDIRYDMAEWRKPEGLNRCYLMFRSDSGKLGAIVLQLEQEINPNSLSDAYGITFTPKVSGLDIAFEPNAYERSEGKVYPKQYPTVYSLIGVAGTSYVVATVGNGGAGAMLRKLGGAQSDGTSFPGKVIRVELISRGLTDTKGLDALK